MNEQAKLLLSAYRPNGQDAGDPVFAEALDAVRTDAELQKWVDEQATFDRKVTEQFATVPVPEGLRDRILAGAKVSRTRPWWRWPRLWALAAVIVMLAVFAQLWTPKAGGIAPWQTQAIAVLDDLEASKTNFDFANNDSAKLLAWLQDQSAPRPDALPKSLGGVATFGCKTWNWDGHRVSMMCFDIGNNDAVHLFTIDRSGLKDVPREGVRRYAQHGPWTLATWSQGDKAHMLVSTGGESKLRGYFALNAVKPGLLATVLLAR